VSSVSEELRVFAVVIRGGGGVVAEPTAKPMPSVDKDAWDYLAYCPNCGTRLQLLKCKARCSHCGFFQDCSDTIV
jgi:hypothetical protein